MTFQMDPNTGHQTWSMTQDAEGNREYRITYRVVTDDSLDGPSLALQTSGLPTIGSSWQVDNESDPWAFCLPTATVKPLVEDEPCFVYDIELVFSSKPPSQNQQRCNNQKIEDPLLEPPKINGGSTKYSEEAATDRFGQFIASSSFEPIRGQVNEWDANRSHIKIEFNVASFAQVQLALAMRDCVNILPLWGFARRCVKLSNVTWDRKYYGLCYVYFSLSMDFDTNPLTFDRDMLDEGHKCLKGHWEAATGDFVLDYIGTGPNKRLPNPLNPTDFIRIPDREGNPSKMVLNGYGLPACAAVRIPLGERLTPRTYGPDYDNAWYLRLESGTEADLLAPPANSDWGRIPNIGLWTGNTPPNWDEELYYRPYAVVQGSPSGVYYALSGNCFDPPPSPNWHGLNSGIVNRGVWVGSTTNYNTGDITRLTASTDPPGTGNYTIQTTIGSKHVEKYNEANFLALGIPVYL